MMARTRSEHVEAFKAIDIPLELRRLLTDRER